MRVSVVCNETTNRGSDRGARWKRQTREGVGVWGGGYHVKGEEIVLLSCLVLSAFCRHKCYLVRKTLKTRGTRECFATSDVYHMGGGLAFGRVSSDVCSSSRSFFDISTPGSGQVCRGLRKRGYRREPSEGAPQSARGKAGGERMGRGLRSSLFACVIV